MRFIPLAPYQRAAVFSPFKHLALFGGVGLGKSCTGSHFAIRMVLENPGNTGFIGANSHDQLTQATLRELFYWLDHYGIEYVADRLPPPAWGYQRAFKTYRNIITVRTGEKPTHIFIRVLSKGEPLRGLEFSWYWIDETRDTPKNTHDIILSRLRESAAIRGLVTTTTNGQDWCYDRFVARSSRLSALYGSMHVPTSEAVRYGTITNDYYQDMLASYSPLMAEQELFARHVNVLGGRAYYASGEYNRKGRSPWGDRIPDPNRPLVVGCDFNYAPAKMMWMVGQTGPSDGLGPYRLPWDQHLHWFGELAESEISSEGMALRLLTQYPGFFYQIYGDASGARSTTSNAGEYDYAQIGHTLLENRCEYTMDYDQSNPLVRNRVEAHNAMLKNAIGQTRLTYDPQACSNYDADMRLVGWRKTVGFGGRAKLDDAGDIQRTHASDGGGYAIYKLFPPFRLTETFGHVKGRTAR